MIKKKTYYPALLFLLLLKSLPSLEAASPPLSRQDKVVVLSNVECNGEWFVQQMAAHISNCELICPAMLNHANKEEEIKAIKKLHDVFLKERIKGIILFLSTEGMTADKYKNLTPLSKIELFIAQKEIDHLMPSINVVLIDWESEGKEVMENHFISHCVTLSKNKKDNNINYDIYKSRVIVVEKPSSRAKDKVQSLVNGFKGISPNIFKKNVEEAIQNITIQQSAIKRKRQKETQQKNREEQLKRNQDKRIRDSWRPIIIKGICMISVISLLAYYILTVWLKKTFIANNPIEKTLDRLTEKEKENLRKKTNKPNRSKSTNRLLILMLLMLIFIFVIIQATGGWSKERRKRVGMYSSARLFH